MNGKNQQTSEILFDKQDFVLKKEKKKKEGLGRVKVCYFSLGQDDGMAGMQDRVVQMCESI